MAVNKPDIITILPPLYDHFAYEQGTLQEWILPDATYCKATSAINGDTTLIMYYPISGINANQIFVNRLLSLKINEWQNPQVMRIYSVKKTLSKANIEIKAEHITNDLRQFVNDTFYLQFNDYTLTPQLIMNTLAMASVSLPPHVSPATSPVLGKRPFPFTFISDGLSMDNPTRNYKTRFMRNNLLEILGGITGSMLDVFGGEIERDNRWIRMARRLGRDQGYRVAYGMNMKEMEFTIDLSNTYYGLTTFCTYGENSDKIWTLRGTDNKGLVIKGNSNSDDYYGTQTLTIDMTDKLDDDLLKTGSTSAINSALLTLSQNYVRDNQNRFEPAVNLKIDVVSLANKPDYQYYPALHNLQLGDDVLVEYDELGVNFKTRMISYEYDCLSRQFTKIELGQPSNNFLKQLRENQRELYYKAFRVKTLTT